VKRALFIILAVVTVVLSVVFSQIYFKLAVSMVPAGCLSALSLGAGRFTFTLWGIILGLAAAVLEGIVLWIATRPRR
jgi:hypothetical protein